MSQSSCAAESNTILANRKTDTLVVVSADETQEYFFFCADLA